MAAGALRLYLDASHELSAEALQRQPMRGSVVNATVMPQTLHLLMRHDNALLRAALSDTIGARAPATGPVTTVEALGVPRAVLDIATFGETRASGRGRTAGSI